MALVEKVTREDLILYEILRNPVLATEFIENFDKQETDEKFELTWYQKEILCDFNNYVSIVAGRSAGKTVSLVSLIRWILVYNVFPTDYIVYLVPSKVHLEPVWTGLVRSFRSNSFLKYFISPNAGINSSDFKITLLNQASLLCRIAGQTGTGVSVIGLHTPVFFVDESGYMPWPAWIELQPTLNTFTSGFRLIVSGVPDGRREKSVCFYADMISSDFSKHRISSDKNPRLTAEDRQRAIEQYGGEDSDDFCHLWKAEHGRPVFSLFDRENMFITQDPVYKLTINGSHMGDVLTEYFSRLSTFPAIPNKNDKVILGIDLGYVEPTAIVILYLDSKGVIHFHGRIRLERISYPIQERVLDYLDTKFNAAIIGIDRGAGGQGISVVQHLMEDTEYAHKNYQKRLVPVDFASSISIGVNQDGEEIKAKTKPFAVSILQDYVSSHKIVFSRTDTEMISELERMTYTRSPTGDIIYKTMTIRGGKHGEDHFTTALLVGALAYYFKNEFVFYKKERKQLVAAGWL